ncbi:MAG: hypothetical protein KKA28_01850 [Planctomycetes bacterium]|nr:hypothetical protein [Planctomycetota bacterium]MCG2685301.1 hypothetical protein [Planctomycetales bacterium]
MSHKYNCFHIHGDNIVECDRTLRLVELALADQLSSVAGPSGSPVCPSFTFQIRGKNKPWQFTFFPGFGRWKEDILQLVRSRGGNLREAADSIITGVTSDREEPLLAIEYCGALPAGNQAWQRNGRAYSFGCARIPYVYVAEIGGYELDLQRTRKAPRLPNPAVPFSYLSYSLSQETPVIPVFIASPGTGQESRRDYAEIFADSELIRLVRAVLFNEPVCDVVKALNKKVVALVGLRASLCRPERSLSPEEWVEAYQTIEGKATLVEYLLKAKPLAWSKKTSIKSLTPSAKQLMKIASRHAIGMTSRDLPICVVSGDKRSEFSEDVKGLYKKLPEQFMEWLARPVPLTICWVLGFKPRG